VHPALLTVVGHSVMIVHCAWIGPLPFIPVKPSLRLVQVLRPRRDFEPFCFYYKFTICDFSNCQD
jgi:hypothetical protein